MCLGLFLISIDGTILNLAIPDLQRDLHSSTAQVQWIIDGFAVVMAGTVLAAGTLGDRIGRRRTFIGGLLLCLIASAAGAVAETSAQVIAARATMGAAAALVMPATLSIIIDLFPEPQLRRRAISLWTAVAGVGGVLGPVLAGWLIEHYSWRSGFWINIPLALCALVPAACLVPESREEGARRLDYRGAALSTAGLTLLVWAVVEGPGHGWTSPSVLTAFAGSTALLAAFIGWQTRCPAPMLPLALLRVPRVGLGLVAMALMSFFVFGLMLVITLYLQGVMDYTALQAGIRALPVSVGMIVGSAVALPLMARMDNRFLILTGTAVLAVAFAVLATFTAHTGYGQLAAFLTVVGAGTGMVLTVSTAMVMGAFPEERAGLGSALNDVTRQVGLALGVAVQGSVLTALSSRRFDDLLADNSHSNDVNSILAAAAAHGPHTPDPPTVTAAKDAFATGMAHSALASSAVLAALVALTGHYLWRTRRREAASSSSVLKLLRVRTTRSGGRLHVHVDLDLRLSSPKLWYLTLLPLLAAPWILRRSTAPRLRTLRATAQSPGLQTRRPHLAQRNKRRPTP